MDERPNKIRIALLAGAVIGAISGIPGLNLINCCCCAGILLGGYIATYLYHQELSEGMQPMQASDCVVLGLSAGVAGAFIGTFLELFISLAFGDIGNQLLQSMMDRLIETLESSGSLPVDAADELRGQVEDAIRESKGTSGFFSSLFSSLVINPLFGMLGALIGYAMLKRKDRANAHVQSGMPQ